MLGFTSFQPYTAAAAVSEFFLIRRYRRYISAAIAAFLVVVLSLPVPVRAQSTAAALASNPALAAELAGLAAGTAAAGATAYVAAQPETGQQLGALYQWGRDKLSGWLRDVIDWYQRKTADGDLSRPRDFRSVGGVLINLGTGYFVSALEIKQVLPFGVNTYYYKYLDCNGNPRDSMPFFLGVPWVERTNHCSTPAYSPSELADMARDFVSGGAGAIPLPDAESTPVPGTRLPGPVVVLNPDGTIAGTYPDGYTVPDTPAADPPVDPDRPATTGDIAGAADAITGAVGVASDAITGAVAGAAGAISDAVGGAAGAISDAVGDAADAIADAVGAAADAAREDAAALRELLEGEAPADAEAVPEDEFSRPNFLTYALEVFSDKFPLDIFGTATPPGAGGCPYFEFFGQRFQCCWLNTLIDVTKIPVLVSFFLWSVMSI